ncbi:2-oxohept-3-enedioate hydratase [Paraburkholderia sp. BL27I4N3]|uniref:2-oxo-hept-4-ene-1,7-dioate hydratase n=1 Tax=Paraburkholderia sp. BL27I4N3 TaxID=1938805 RepID=UPI000E24D3E9|nr:2-oxo-hepta-3-ene-1,7-dioic acid hydratase [Paraburkholderia sp. BL27I4N3]REE07413.1 2-oxohept-3-enedioate hydratase [Paraburkholderia sp. BL27I4N3]
METTLDPNMIAQLAQQLEDSERTREQIRPYSIDFPRYTIADAYAVQAEWMKLKLADGKRTVKGHKIGLTSRAMQVSAGINEPDSGVLLDNMLLYDGAEISMDTLIVPKVEVELAFILKRDLEGPDCTIFDVLDATDYVVPALEIIDSRFYLQDPETKLGRKVVDTISDNACNAALVMGGRPVKPTEVDLRWVSALCYRNVVIEESGVAAAVLNHPANGVAWLANKIAANGEKLRAGQVVLAGSFTRPIFAKAGDVFHVDYGTLGSISCRFN